ncbi:hypothetical protein P692DRAFT_20870361 [Suillus brevipes Sb2]|nr:hypothetical protein P692DRAFT_20870361 [Suillus brevipes Sb2]
MKIQFTYLTILATFAGVNAAVASTCLKNRQDPEGSFYNAHPSPVNDSSDTDIIVGGAVGGVATLALLALLIICLRRRRKRDEFDDNRIVSHCSGGGTLPQVDLGDECGIASYPESPFLADSAGAGAAAAAGIYRTTSPLSSPSENSDIATPPGEGYPSQGFVRPGPAQYPQTAQSMYAMQQADWHN